MKLMDTDPQLQLDVHLFPRLERVATVARVAGQAALDAVTFLPRQTDLALSTHRHMPSETAE